jgi:hypothetical protein
LGPAETKGEKKMLKGISVSDIIRLLKLPIKKFIQQSRKSISQTDPQLTTKNTDCIDFVLMYVHTYVGIVTGKVNLPNGAHSARPTYYAMPMNFTYIVEK